MGGIELAPTHDAETSLTNANSLEFELQGSELPPGFTLSTGGVLSGTPTLPGTHTFRVRMTDGLGRYTQKSFSLSVPRAVPRGHL